MDEMPGGYQNALLDQVAIITGAAKGIGRGIALGFAQAGAHIVIADIDSAESANTARAVEQLGRQALVVKTDVRREEELDNLVDQTLAQFKRIDILVNNAGINATGGFLGVTRQDMRSVIDTDLIGPFILTQRTALEMVQRGTAGRILCVSSIHSVVAHYHPHYSIAKAGLERLVIDAALELAPHHIRVNGIRPGGIMIRGDLVYGNPLNQVPAIPLEHRNGLPAEVADLALFLATDHSRYITGAIITIDGALSQLSYSALGSYDNVLAIQQKLGIPQPPSGTGMTVQEIQRGSK
jgi:NAD(P)-dependent dehydrogenase (short-subunit alcohol dehydrogenase family)